MVNKNYKYFGYIEYPDKTHKILVMTEMDRESPTVSTYPDMVSKDKEQVKKRIRSLREYGLTYLSNLDEAIVEDLADDDD